MVVTLDSFPIDEADTQTHMSPKKPYKSVSMSDIH